MPSAGVLLTSDGDSVKARANALFREKQYLKAAALYTQALRAEGAEEDQAVLHSNRSAALLKLNKVSKALEDADRCIELSPQWIKGYYRRAAALEALDKWEEALLTFKTALDRCADNENKDLVAQCRRVSRHLTLHHIAEHKGAAPAPPAPPVVAAFAPTQPQPLSEEQRSGLAFADSWLDWAAEQMREAGCGFTPLTAFKRGPRCTMCGKEAEAAANVQAAHAFTSPETLAEFAAYCRTKGAELDAASCVVVAPMPAIAFPQTWRHQRWPYGTEEGVFVLLQAPQLRRLWFIRLSAPNQPRLPEVVDAMFLQLPAFLFAD